MAAIRALYRVHKACEFRLKGYESDPYGLLILLPNSGFGRKISDNQRVQDFLKGQGSLLRVPHELGGENGY